MVKGTFTLFPLRRAREARNHRLVDGTNSFAARLSNHRCRCCLLFLSSAGSAGRLHFAPLSAQAHARQEASLVQAPCRAGIFLGGEESKNELGRKYFA